MEEPQYSEIGVEIPLKEELSELLETSTFGYSIGTGTSYVLHALLRNYDGVTPDISAPDNLLNAAAVVVPYMAIRSVGKSLSKRKNRVLRYVGIKIKAYAGLLAIVPALAYEVFEMVTGTGIHPESTPTPLGTTKDVLSYAVTGVSLFWFDRKFNDQESSQNHPLLTSENIKRENYDEVC
ncbi:MAG: hypothetical protein GOV00_03630 [Candidatus Altiarchaeota archaeon]|nr:hypothetical protein [Candidatus Altiarchaeota archaeon]